MIHKDNGAMAIIVALLTTVLIGVGAFAVDFGLAYSEKRQLSIAADAAALAAARNIERNAAVGESCGTLRAREAPAARVVAEDYSDNKNSPGSQLLPGAAGFSVTCHPTLGLLVSVNNSRPVDTLLGGVFGANGITVGRSARAVVGPAGAITGLRPYAVCEGIADSKLLVEDGLAHTITFDNASSGCGSAPGNWGIIDFDGGSNPSGEIEEWTRYGYGKPISGPLPIVFNGQPGAPSPGALEAEMNSILDKDIVIPVYDTVVDPGQNSRFRIVKFIGIRLCAWKFNNQSNQGACYDSTEIPLPAPANYMQVKFARVVPIAELSGSCRLGDSCDTGLRVIKLAD